MTKKGIRVICFCIGFFALLILFGSVLKPARMVEVAIENYHAGYEGIYELEPDTLDVVFLGSSHVFCSVSPEDIFEAEGITSYVLASSCQRVWQSYYNLEEVFRRQSPKAVILDVFMCLNGNKQSEAFNREAIEPMNLSLAKLEAIRTAVDKNPDQESFLSYLLPVFRYHDRWESLEEGDFLKFLKDPHSETKGYIPRMAITSAVFNEADYKNSDMAELNQICEGYLQKINDLCNKNHAEFILVKFPTCLWNGANALAVQNFADKAGIRYLDFCADENLIRAVNIDWSTETLDRGNHLNYDGSMKVSKFMSEFLREQFQFTDKRNDPLYKRWKEDYNYYKRCIENYAITNAQRLSDLTDHIGNGYTVAVSLKDIDIDRLSTADREAFACIGIQDQQLLKAKNMADITILEHDSVIHQSFHDVQTEWEAVIDNNKWKVRSMKGENSDTFSCLIAGKEKVTDCDGIGIVIWDQKLRKFIECGQIKLGE